MSVRRLDPNQPKDFEFTPENLAWAKQQIAKYPGRPAAGRGHPAAVARAGAARPMAARARDPLYRRYARHGLYPGLEIATFYTMFNLSPVGRYHVQLCGTTPCMLRGSDEIKKVCKRVIGEEGQVTPEGVFSWVEVECMGACVNAPMVQINKDYYEDSTPETFEAMLEAFKRGRDPKPGPQTAGSSRRLPADRRR